MLRTRAVLSGSLLIIMCACSDQAPSPEVPTTLTLSQDTVILADYDTTVVLTAEVRDENGALLVDTPVEWSSTAPGVIGVSDEGEVRATSPGLAHVVAQVGDLQDTALVVSANGLISVLGPETVRQGEAFAIAAAADSSDPLFAALGTLSLELLTDSAFYDPEAGLAVGYGDSVRFAVTSSRLPVGDTVATDVQPRSIGATLSVLGQGERTGEPISSDFWIHGSVAYSGTSGGFGCVGPDCTCFTVCGDQLMIWSLNSPDQPMLVDSVTIPDALKVNDVKISTDGQLTIASAEGGTDDGGLAFLDTSSPLNPTLLTMYKTNLSGGVHNLWIEDIMGTRYVFAVAHQDHGLRIIDASDPSAPVEVSSYYAGSSIVHDVYVRDGLAFVSHWDEGLVILDVGNGMMGGTPAAPVVVSTWEAPFGHVHNAWYWPEGEKVLVGIERFLNPGAPADSVGRVRVVDVSDMTQPREIATYTIPGTTPHNFWMDEARAVLFVGWYTEGAVAIDVSGAMLGELDKQGRTYAHWLPDGPAGPGSIWAPQVHNDRLYLIDQLNGIWVMSFQID